MNNQVRQLGGVREHRQEAMKVVRGMLSASQGRAAQAVQFERGTGGETYYRSQLMSRGYSNYQVRDVPRRFNSQLNSGYHHYAPHNAACLLSTPHDISCLYLSVSRSSTPVPRSTETNRLPTNLKAATPHELRRKNFPPCQVNVNT